MPRPAFEDLGNGPNSRRRGPAASSDEVGPGLLPSLRERVEALVAQTLSRLPCTKKQFVGEWRAKLQVLVRKRRKNVMSTHQPPLCSPVPNLAAVRVDSNRLLCLLRGTERRID